MAVALNFITTSDQGDTLFSHTHTAVAIGTASADRIVVVVGHSRGNNGVPAWDDVTIGGVDAPIRVQAISTSNGNLHAVTVIASLLVTSGTTADIITSYSQSKFFSSIEVYTLTAAASAVPSATGSDIDADPLTDTITIPSNGAAIGGETSYDGATTVAWTNLTEDTDRQFDSATISAASTTSESGSTALTATLASGELNSSAVFAAWASGTETIAKFGGRHRMSG